MPNSLLRRLKPGYAAIAAAAAMVGIVVGWTSFGQRIDDYAYDFLFVRNAPDAANSDAVLLAIDDATFAAHGGVRQLRSILADALEKLAPAHPSVVAVDVILHDAADPREDARLARAFSRIPNLVLATDLDAAGWEDPLPVFTASAAAIGHVQSDDVSHDGVTRQIPLEKIHGRTRRWALALEAYRLARGMPLIESPEDVHVGSRVIPARFDASRPVRVGYTWQPAPTLSVDELIKHPAAAARLAGKTVFLGVTSLSSTRDRVYTPLGGPIPGLAVHAYVYDTIAAGAFLRDSSDLAALLACLLIAAAAGLLFALVSGWPAYVSGALLVAAAHVMPFVLFRQGTVFPYLAPVTTAWLAVVGAATYRYFAVERQLRRSETERTRYRQAIHFVTHEMRSPLTAIQGSSELMSRYNLTDDKRKQIATMIHAESKRLARMIQTFLDVERLSEGQMDFKREPFTLTDVVANCTERVRPLAERKQIAIETDGNVAGVLLGDRELFEYAVYNLLTNAIKYSPTATTTTVTCSFETGMLRLSVRDQGIGMDASETGKVFQRFYRTRRAEASGETGTGIGLSIVQQIVELHGGRIQVSSTPGEGSCFTVIVPAQSGAGSLAACPR